MERYKFRAKREGKQDWVYGFILHDFDHEYSSQGYDDVPPRTYQISDINGDRCNVITETVGQYTGLKDKNEKEIYEGDIVKCHYFYEALGEGLGVYEAEHEFEGEITFEELGLWIQTNTQEHSGYLAWIQGLHEESFEVIGNIHDNLISK